MSGKDLLDSMNYIDEHLIEAAETQRLSRGVAWWRKLGTMAACLCAVLLAAFGYRYALDIPGQGKNAVLDSTVHSTAGPDTVQQTKLENTPVYSHNKDQNGPEAHSGIGEPASYWFAAQSFRTNGGAAGVEYPAATVIRSRQELENYCAAREYQYDLESDGFLAACEKYDEAYFQNNDLILIALEEGSGSVAHQVTDVRKTDTGDWVVTVCRHVPQVGTCDVTQWHILLEVQMGKRIDTRDTVTVEFTTQEQVS